MTFLPIVGRELRVAARRKRTYWARTGAASMAFVVIGWMLMTTARWMDPAMIARSIFGTLTMLLFVYALFCGTGATADCVSSEKREGTLGLLFLTDLKGYDIVLGKLAAAALGNFYSLLAALPVLAIPLLLGGVGVDELIRAAALLLNTMFFSVAAGMWVSVRAHDERRAMSGTFGVILLFLVVLPAIGILIGQIWNNQYTRFDDSSLFSLAFYYPSPGFSMGMLQSISSSKNALMHFWSSLAVTLVISIALLFDAARRLPRVWQDEARQRGFAQWLGCVIASIFHAIAKLFRSGQQQSGPRAASGSEFLDRLFFGESAQRKRLRDWLLDENPYLWLAARERLKPVVVWAFLGGLALLWAIGGVWGYKWFFNPATYILTALTLHTVLKFWIVTEAARCLNNDRRSGALELLLSTPLTVQEILRGQLRALRMQFGKPVLTVLVVDVCLMLAYKENGRTDGEWIATWVAGTTVFLGDLWFLAWVGMWQGLKSKSIHQAVQRATGLVLLLPWVLYFISMTVIDLSSRASIGFGTAIGVWFFLSMIIGAFTCLQARTKLANQLRSYAMERYQPPSKAWWWPFGRRREEAPPVMDA